MNFEKLLQEYIEGCSKYFLVEAAPATSIELQFFVRHAHQIAADDGDYDAFVSAFPNFFMYHKHEAAFMVWKEGNQ